MVQVRRAARLLLAAGSGVFVLLLTPGPALAEDDPVVPSTAPAASGTGWCAATGHVAASTDELTHLRRELAEQEVRLASGVPLDRQDLWLLPDGALPVVVLDSTEPLPGGTVSVVAGGQRFEVDSTGAAADEVGHRYVTSVVMPHLGPTIRTMGLQVEAGPCVTELTLVVDRSLWSTQVGRAAVAVTALVGLLTVLVARMRRGGWLRRFLFAAPLGAVAGAGQAVILYEAGMLDPFGTLPWWGPVAGLAVAAVLPLTRWPRQRPTAPVQEAGPGEDAVPGERAEPGEEAVPGERAEPGEDAVPVDKTAPAGGTGRVGALVSVVVAVVAAGAVGAAAVLLDAAPAQARPMVITPEQAEVIFVQTVADGLAQRHGHIALEVRSSVHALTTTYDGVVDERPQDVEIGVPPDQHDYPAWFVGSARIPYDDSTASVFARFTRVADDEPWQMTGFTWTVDGDLAAPHRDSGGWLRASPDTGRLAVDPDELVGRYIVWQGRQFVTAGELDTGEVVDDELLALHPHGQSYLRDLADWPDNPTSAEIRLPSGVSGDETDDSGESLFRYSVANQAFPEVEELSVVPLADGTALVSFVLTVHRTVANSPEGAQSCDARPRFAHSGRDYRVFATDYQVLVWTWVPMGPAADPEPGADPTASPTPGGSPAPAASPAPMAEPDTGPVLDEDGEPLTILLSDQVIHTDRPAERSERC